MPEFQASNTNSEQRKLSKFLNVLIDLGIST